MSAARHVRTHLPQRAIVGLALLAFVAGSNPASIDRPSTSRVIEAKVASGTSSSRAAPTSWVQDAYAKLPLSFEANVGQTDAQVDFLARGNGYTLFLTSGEAVFSLRSARESARQGPARTEFADATRLSGSVLRMQFVGGNASARVSGKRPLGGTVNYFIGNDPTRWRTHIPTYATVAYHDVYPGIDVAYYGDQGRLEYDFVVAPGADPTAIALRFAGADRMRIDGLGDLILGLAAGEIRQQKPRIYQEVGGSVRAVSGAYLIAENGDVRFALGAYDPSRPLVIDPVLAYATYLGGTGFDEGHAIAVDAFFNAHVTGRTSSSDFPTSSGAFDTTLVIQDAFVTKLNPTGTALVYSTYLGGGNFGGGASEIGLGIAVDIAGNAYVTGATNSQDFPTTPGAPDTTVGGASSDAFVTKLNSAGTNLLYSTYLGGTGSDIGNGIVVDSTGNAYVTGQTFGGIPTSTGAFDATPNGFGDAFVTKLNTTGTVVLYSTYLGGSDSDSGRGIAIDPAGSAYVTGNTLSLDFPTSTGAFDIVSSGSEAFVTKLNSTGTGLVYSTYLGGSDGGEAGNGVAVDIAGSAYLTGFTNSTDFPTSGGAFDTTLGFQDAFVTKLNPGGSALVYSTYLGGGAGESGFGIAVDSAGSAYVTGTTGSTDFPTSGGAFDTTASGPDAFVTKLNPGGTDLIYSTYLGGGNQEQGRGITIDIAGSAYVAGVTSSADFPTTPGAFDATLGSGPDGFVAKIIEVGPPATLTLDPAAAVNPVGNTHCVTATVQDAAGNPTPGVTVRFSVVGAETTFSTPSSGSDTTDTAGQAMFCFTAALPGDNIIHAFADTNHDGDEDALGEPTGNANKTWTVPASTELCEVMVTDAGRITAANGDRAKFHGVARSDADGNASGKQVYEDLGPAQPLKVESTEILAVTCSEDRTTATIFGEATIDGTGSFQFRIRVTDNGGPGRNDIYGIILSNGYASGDQMLDSGNVQIH